MACSDYELIGDVVHIILASGSYIFKLQSDKIRRDSMAIVVVNDDDDYIVVLK